MALQGRERLLHAPFIVLVGVAPSCESALMIREDRRQGGYHIVGMLLKHRSQQQRRQNRGSPQDDIALSTVRTLDDQEISIWREDQSNYAKAK